MRMRKMWKTKLLFLAPFPGFIPHNFHTLHQLAMSLEDYMNPFHCGFLSMVLRNAPFENEQDGFDHLEKGVQKEIRAAISIHHPAILDYSSVFDQLHTQRYIRLYHNLPILEDVARDLHRSFRSTQRTFSTTSVIFPRYSEKLVGKIARRNASACEELWDGGKIKTTMDAEKFFMKTGMKVDGPVEIGMAWKYNELKPRVFYKRGPTVYFSSQYIQQIYNIIIDSIVSVNRRTRFQSATVEMTEQDIAFIYDYSSFTSSLEEIRNFTLAMARFYKGTKVGVVDSRDGLVYIDLGDYLEEYNSVCNTNAEFDCSDILESPVEILLQHSCGMLGVPGNITGCTLLHGIHLAFIVGGLMRGKAVGDDAFGVKAMEYGTVPNISELLEQVRNIGVVAEEKTEIWTKRDKESDKEIWNYLKRPISRVGATRMDFGDLVDWPGAAGILDLQDSLHTTPLDNLVEDRLKRFNGQVTSLLRSLESKGYVNRDYQIFLNRFLRASYDRFGVDRETWRLPSMPDLILVKPSWQGDHVRELLEHNARAVIKVPEFWVPGSSLPDFRRGSVFTYTSCPSLKYLRDMGFIYMEKRTRWMVVDEEPEVFKMLMCRDGKARYKIAYDVCVQQDVPDWFYEVLDSAHVPHERLVPYDMDVKDDFGLRNLLD